MFKNLNEDINLLFIIWTKIENKQKLVVIKPTKMLEIK